MFSRPLPQTVQAGPVIHLKRRLVSQSLMVPTSFSNGPLPTIPVAAVEMNSDLMILR